MPHKDANAKRSATERVEAHIRQAIYSGKLRPRERVIEEDLAKQLKCSRGPVREALLRLERDGLIVTVPRRGTFVRDISLDSIEVIFSIRGKLEALCVRYLRQEMTEDTEQILRTALSAMKMAANEQDEQAFLREDLELHRTIWKLAKRDLLYRTLNTTMNPFIFMVARTFSHPMSLRKRYRNHEAYVDMILNTSIDSIEAAVEDYFRNLFENLRIGPSSHLLLAGGGEDKQMLWNPAPPPVPDSLHSFE